jgi:signal transduction histidine kinase
VKLFIVARPGKTDAMHDKLFYLKGILLFSIFATFLTSCNNTDRKKDVLISPQLHNAIEIATQKFDSGYVDQSITYLDSVYDKSGYVSVRDRYQYYNFYYDHYNRINRHNLAKQYVDSMLVLIEFTDNTDEMAAEYAEANYFMGDLLFEEGYYEDAYKYYYKAKTIAKTNKDACRLAYYDYRIGMVLYKDEQYSNAVRSFKQAFFESSACNSDFAFFFRKQEVLDNIGLCYYKLDMPDSALVYYQKALHVIDTSCNGYISSRVRLCNTAKAVIWGNMASAYDALGMKDTAERLLLSSIRMNSQLAYDPLDAQSTRLKLAALYLEQGRHAEMHKVLDDIKAISATYSSKAIQVGYHQMMWQYLKSIGRIQDAYSHLSQYVSLSDSIRKVNKNILLRDIGEGVSSLEKQYQIEDLNKQTELRNISLIIAVVIFIMAGIIFSQLIYTWKKTKKNVQQLTAANAQVKDQKGKLEQVLMELQKADEEKDRILKAVSHDLRSPMNISLSLTELILSERENLSDEQLEYIELIRNSCNNALSLTKELLDVATLNTELMIKEWVDLNEVVSKNVEVLRFRAAEKKQRISMQLPEKSIKLKINRDKVSRVVNNLINNAIKFSPNQSQINIKVQAERRGATIAVTDHGIGIPDNLKEKVFDLFTEAKRIGTSGEEPYGLGLSISKQIVDVHGGKIWFDSQVGKGTTFYVYLPDQYNNYVRKV